MDVQNYLESLHEDSARQWSTIRELSGKLRLVNALVESEITNATASFES